MASTMTMELKNLALLLRLLFDLEPELFFTCSGELLPAPEALREGGKRKEENGSSKHYSVGGSQSQPELSQRNPRRSRSITKQALTFPLLESVQFKLYHNSNYHAIKLVARGR